MRALLSPPVAVRAIAIVLSIAAVLVIATVPPVAVRVIAVVLPVAVVLVVVVARSRRGVVAGGGRFAARVRCGWAAAFRAGAVRPAGALVDGEGNCLKCKQQKHHPYDASCQRWIDFRFFTL